MRWRWLLLFVGWSLVVPWSVLTLAGSDEPVALAAWSAACFWTGIGLQLLYARISKPRCPSLHTVQYSRRVEVVRCEAREEHSGPHGAVTKYGLQAMKWWPNDGEAVVAQISRRLKRELRKR